MADRTIVLAQNKRHSLRGLTQINPQEFAAYQEDDDQLTYIVDMSSYLDGATISSVTRTSNGPVVSNTSNTTTRLTQRLKGFGYVDFRVTTSSGDIEEFRITINPRANSSFFLPSIASVPQNTAQLWDIVADVTTASIDNGISWIRTQGYYTVGDGGGALYKRVYSVPSHGAYITSNAATAYWELAETSPSVLQTGARGDGTTDDAAAFQAAIDMLTSGGVVNVGVRNYNIATPLVANQGVLIRGDIRTDLSNNTNGSGSVSRARIRWSGADGATMYTIRPASTGNVVWGGGAENIEWDGGALAATAVHLDNTKYALFDGKVRNTKVAAVKLSSISGSVGNFSQYNEIRSLEYVWGAAVACQNSHGLQIMGNGSNVPATQHTCGVIFGLVYNGSLVSISETDNARFTSVHGVVQSGGTGRAIDLLAGGAQDANANFFEYVVGPVRFANGIYGNTILHYQSEGGGISQASGTSLWDGRLKDYVTGLSFRTHEFALREKLSIPSGSLIGESGLTVGNFSLLWPSWILANGVTNTVGCIVPRPYHLANGVLEGVEVIVGSNGTSGGNYRLQMRAGTWNEAGTTTPEVDMTQTSAAGSQYVSKLITFTFSPEVSYSRNDDIFLRFTRYGLDAADTNSDDMYVLGIRVLFRGTGPDSSGSGSYTIPSP